MDRIRFKLDSRRHEFFDKVKSANGFKTWADMKEHFYLLKGTLDKYRSGKLSLPIDLYKKMINSAGTIDEEYSNEIIILNSNWGRRKGGIITYVKHKNIFENGRKKGILILRQKKHECDINIPLNIKLSYILGLFIGDGFTNKYGGYYLTQFVGHKKEKGYYTDLIFPYIKDVFDVIPKIKEEKKANAIRANIYSKDIFLILTKRFGIKPGRKSYDVLIPQEILNSSREILLSCISGIFDAEGCVFLDKRAKYREPYPRIDLHMINPKIILQIHNILIEEGVSHSITNGNTQIDIYGFENISKFMNKIGLLNPKHLDKLENFKGL